MGEEGKSSRSRGAEEAQPALQSGESKEQENVNGRDSIPPPPAVGPAGLQASCPRRGRPESLVYGTSPLTRNGLTWSAQNSFAACC